MAHDLVIRGGTIVDGTGHPGVTGDVAIDGDRLAQVGGRAGAGRRELDAGGLAVTPGFVDPHTHYDAQICWDQALTPSCWHGVTSVVMGNSASRWPRAGRTGGRASCGCSSGSRG